MNEAFFPSEDLVRSVVFFFFFLFSLSMTTEMKDKLPPAENGSVWAVAPAGVVPGGGVCSQSLCSRSGSERKQALVRHSERRA